ncbi:hypothetical protein [Enterocloster bolteae]|uniref:hypothetical protein n=1 Tax=Enterocloster bolteae TaxID=208479 RepID=UPI002A7FDCFC|nr:hypothetical protein [Enterocloster bolteae]
MANEHAIQATGTFVVSKGFRLLTKLAASQGSLQFTRAAVGTGKPPEGYSPESMIGLNAYKIDAEIADYGVQDDMAYITVQVSSDNVTEGFLVTEVGVFAEDPDEGEILYGYMDISTDPTYIYANGSTNRSKFAEFTLYVLIGSVSNVIAAVTPGSIITRDTFTAANLKAIDTHGILGGEAGAGTTGQGLIDALTNKLLTEFVTNTGLMERLGTYVLKSKIVNDFLSTDEETVLSGPMGKLLKEQLNVLNTKSVYAANGQYIYNYVTAHYTYQNNVVGIIPICVKEGSAITVDNVQACLTGSSAYYDVTKNVISFERQNDYCIGIALELSNAYANTALRVTFTISP